MFEEAQYFAPVATRDDGTVEVELAASHPVSPTRSTGAAP